MTTLDDHRVLVIGGTSDIGLMVARQAVAAEARVTVASRTPDRHRDAIAAIGAVQALAVDVTDSRSIDALMTGEPWDHIVVSAAETPTGPARSLDPDAARGAMASKFWGAYDVARLAHIGDQGSLMLVSGFLAARPSPTATLQGAINAEIEGLVRGLALKLASARINAVSPGTVDTPLWHGLDDRSRRAMLAIEGDRLPVGRVGKPDDIARAALFLMNNGFATGSVVLVDGGSVIA